MNELPGNGKKTVSTPERKKEYVQRWLDDNLSNRYADSERKTPSDLLEDHKECQESSGLFNSPTRNFKFTSACGASPVLGGKRFASSPVIGGQRRISKRLKLVEKSSKTSETEEIKPSSLKLEEANVTERNVKISESENEVNKIINLECSDIFNETTDDFLNIPKLFEHPVSQIIESPSSGDKSRENSEVVQEIHSLSDKTASDLIEDISTQLNLETPCRDNRVQLSQNISTPSSHSSDESNYGEAKKVNLVADNTNQQFLDTFASSNPIDTVSTLESRTGTFNRTPYILHYVEEKTKRKKNPKKGSLLELLVTTVAKERSSVNLLRHQLCKKSNTDMDKTFVLFQIVEHLPRTNNNQLFKCSIISDSMGLLNDLLKNKTNCSLITLMSVPEISSLVNTNEKPILKVYEPLIILDTEQLFIHVTKFIAITSKDSGNLNLIDESMKCSDLKVVHKYHCPCLDENLLSLKCESKYTENLDSIAKMLFDYC